MRHWAVFEGTSRRLIVGMLFAAFGGMSCQAPPGTTRAPTEQPTSAQDGQAASTQPTAAEQPTSNEADAKDEPSVPTIADDIIVATGVWCIRLDDRVDCRSFGADEVSLSLPGEKQEAWFSSGGVCATDSAGTIECKAWSGRPASAGMRSLESLPPIAARAGNCMRDESGRVHVLNGDAVKSEPELGLTGELHCEHGLACNLADGQLRCLWPKRGGDVWMQPFSEEITGAVEPERLARATVSEVYEAPHVRCVRTDDRDLFCRSAAEFTNGAVYENSSLSDATHLALTEHAICGAVGGELKCATGTWWKEAVVVPGVRDVIELGSTRHWFVARDRSGTVSFARAGTTSAPEHTIDNVDGMALGAEGVCVVRGRDAGCFALPVTGDIHWVSL